MKRRLLNLLTILSLLVCVTFALLWAQSWWSPDARKAQWKVPGKPGQRAAYTAYSQWGRLQFSWGEGEHLPAVLVGFFRHSEWRPDLAHPWRVVGVYVERQRPGAPARFWYVSVPHGLLVALTAPLPLFRGARLFDRRLKRRRAAAGLCPSCGYDLRATPDRCPECGDEAGAGAGPSGPVA